jgi:peptidoglycan/LPS O-acetylase OafA/YrhL
MANHPGASWVGAVVVYLAMCEWLPTIFRTFHFGAWGVQEVIGAAYAVVAGLIILPAVFAPRARHLLPQRLLSVRALGWLGLVSYGLYLYHVPVLVGVQRLGLQHLIPGQEVLSYVIVALPVTVALAGASYYLIEKPVLRLKVRRSEPAEAAAREPELEPMAVVARPH